MCNKQSIPMVVSSEFLTNLARTWLWEEKRPTQSCINFLVMALDLDMDKARDIAIQILEGRKKLVGNNVFTLEDDNEQIRPIMDLTQDLEKENLLLKIQMDMQTNFLFPGHVQKIYQNQKACTIDSNTNIRSSRILKVAELKDR